MDKTVGIVIVNYNGAKFQNDAIRSLYEMNDQNYEIVIVDNSSTDNSIELLHEKYPEVKVIEAGYNSGVAEGNNIGIRYFLEKGTDYILLLNNDVEVDDNMLSELQKSCSSKEIVVPKIYYFSEPKKIWYAGGVMKLSRATTIHVGEGEEDHGQYDSEKYVDYAPTCCMLVPSEVFKNIGLMDSNYFMYYDDTDFVLRATNAGYKIKYNPKSFLWHKVSSSSGGNFSKLSLYYGTRNRLYFIHKFWKQTGAITLLYTNITRLVYYVVYSKKNPNFKVIKEAYRDYRNNKMGRWNG